MHVDSGSGDRKNRNVELNVVPFIDLMSCLTAFLLVTAVWTQSSQVTGSAAAGGEQESTEGLTTSMLVTPTDVRLGVSNGWQAVVPLAGDSTHDWAQVQAELRELRDGMLAGRAEIEIAIEDSGVYSDLIDAMDSARGAGFSQLGVVEARALSFRFAR